LAAGASVAADIAMMSASVQVGARRGEVAIEDDREGALSPELMLPSQFAELSRSEASRPPELRLMLAILEDAIRVYQKTMHRKDQRSERLFHETAEWFNADDLSWPFSFAMICETLGLDPGYVRSGFARAQPGDGACNAVVRSITLPVRRATGLRHRVTARRCRHKVHQLRGGYPWQRNVRQTPKNSSSSSNPSSPARSRA
jgi:hypothetical protein